MNNKSSRDNVRGAVGKAEVGDETRYEIERGVML